MVKGTMEEVLAAKQQAQDDDNGVNRERLLEEDQKATAYGVFILRRAVR
ncbi:hypothetical protein [Paenibacillus xylaniclasticus]|nr:MULTISPECIES: hypothetical protein [Paenibacillus]GFN30030.1 hypothetical protein PCURB6_02900 [Paenibacillus curdlanolyticus]